MKKETDGMDYSKLEKQLHDEFQHLDELEIGEHLKSMKKDRNYTSGDKKLDKRLSSITNLGRMNSSYVDPFRT